MGVGSNPTSDKIIFALFLAYYIRKGTNINRGPYSLTDSRVAQWKRAGPITQRSVDRNYALLVGFFFILFIQIGFAKLEPILVAFLQL